MPKKLVVDCHFEIEELRRIVAASVPFAYFHQTKKQAEEGECRFRLMMGESVYVRTPTTRKGLLRERLGLWMYRLGKRGLWRYSTEIGSVVAFIEQHSQRVTND